MLRVNGSNVKVLCIIKMDENMFVPGQQQICLDRISEIYNIYTNYIYIYIMVFENAYFMSKKSLLISYGNLPCEIVQDFLDIQYIRKNTFQEGFRCKAPPASYV